MINTLLENPAEIKTQVNPSVISQKSFAKLYELYFPLVQRICNRYTKNYELAQDLAQEVFLKIHDRMESFQGQSQPSTWLYRITVNHCLDYLRWKKRNDELFINYSRNAADTQSTELSHDHPIKRLFQHLLEDMDERTRQVIFLYYDVGLTHQEIAHISGISRVAITRRIARFNIMVSKIKTELSESMKLIYSTNEYQRNSFEDCTEGS